jgi:hypothetical protein
MKTPNEKYASKAKKKARKLISDVIAFMNNDIENPDERHATTRYAKAVWEVFTALRGPDSNNYNVKEITTQQIRSAIGLQAQNAGGAFTGIGLPKGIANPDEFTVQHRENRHFVTHYGCAVEALEILGFIEKIEYFD